MDPRLRDIANLEFAKAVERISREMREKLVRVQAMPRGGMMQHQRLRVQLEQAEEVARARAQIWQELLEKNNGGHLTRQDVAFIAQEVREVLAARKGALMNNPTQPLSASGAGEMARRLSGIEASIKRDLEIQVRRQEILPREKIMADAADASDPRHINVTIHNAANVNLGSQIGEIHATLNAFSGRDESHREIASLLQEVSEAVTKDPHLPDAKKHEALQVVKELAKQAQAKPEERSQGVLSALIAGFPTVIQVAADLVTLWGKGAPLIARFFGM